MNITISVIASIAALLIYMYGGRFYRFCVYVRRLNKIPGPNFLPFIGTPYFFLSNRLEDHIEVFKAASFKCKDRWVRTWLFFEGAVIINKPEHVEVILRSNDQITKAKGNDYLVPFVGWGLVTSTGSQHSRDRKLIAPTFHSYVLDKFTDVMLKNVTILNTCIENNIIMYGDKPFDIFPLTLKCALDVICETAMGVNIHAQDGESHNEYINAVETLIQAVPARIFQPWLASDWIFKRTSLGKASQHAIKIINDFTTRVIEKKQEERKFSSMNQRDEWNDQTAGKRNKQAFLDLLLDANEKDDSPLVLQQIIDQTTTIILAGHDTSGGLIGWTLFSVGADLAVQKRVHAELDEVLGDCDEYTSLKLLPKLKYLERVIKEVLRLYPSVPIMNRQMTRDFQIEDHTIPKDTSIYVSLFNLHRDPVVWPDPLRFDPDRFLPENIKDRHPYAYMPFSAGLRSCIGQKYAMLEVKLAIAQVLRKFDVKSIDNHETVKLYAGVTLKPVHGVYITMRKRQRNLN